jgi:hypothetical protein
MTIDTVQAIARSEIINRASLFSLQTTDATPTLLFSVDTIGAEVGIIEYTILGLSDDGLTVIAVNRKFRYKNDGTTLTLGTEYIILFESDFTTADVTIAVNVNTIEVSVTGELSTINWSGNYSQQKLNVEVVLP